jgi:hypothetical protein
MGFLHVWGFLNIAAPLEELKAQGITHVLTPAMIAGFTHCLYAEVRGLSWSCYAQRKVK